ncbi:MAG: hypothetical protein CVU88_05750 [Firmicutes bacterium HGW-Firmicutes-13]|nr:MAG: hypothetical protein CVU88_05750 [Firmicutes bacterium HGW-Firmicutes-13]
MFTAVGRPFYYKLFFFNFNIHGLVHFLLKLAFWALYRNRTAGNLYFYSLGNTNRFFAYPGHVVDLQFLSYLPNIA